MDKWIEHAKKLYELEDCVFSRNAGHEGGRNLIAAVSRGGEDRFVLRVSALGDRTEEELLAETEFVHFLAQNGAPVADVIPSVNGRSVERVVRRSVCAPGAYFAVRHIREASRPNCLF